MDFSRLQDLQSELNSTSSASNLPSTLLELVIPGYSTISQLAFRLLGIDIGLLVTGWALVFGCRTAWRYLYDLVYEYLEEYYTSSVQIDDDDDLFNLVKAWVAEQKTRKPVRKLKAVTDYDDNNKKNNEDSHDERGYYKYELPGTRYEPSYGINNEFDYNGRYFKVVRSYMNDENRGRGGLKETLEIFCYGQTTQPIRDLLLHIKQWKVKHDDTTTSVYRPHMPGGYWTCRAERPSRPLETVSLEQEQKDEIVDDVNEYLHPATARWYAARGIPHRRGYLFYGPPGTGKSSLSFALAGIFRLSLYLISLNDPKLTEGDLATLFDELPDRCVLLLEDVDSAGLKRAEESTSEDETKKNTRSSSSNKDAKKEGTEDTSKTDKPTGSISLSALLNVIDGAAAHEGHVLIMTSNTPESLDAALIRPGRVDVQVGFTLATKSQIQDIFLRMYSSTPEEQATASTATRSPKVKFSSRPKTTDPETLKDMARRFAEQFPEETFSPAEIQGYLLKRKREPQRALDDVAKWREEAMEAKKKGKKLVGAQ